MKNDIEVLFGDKPSRSKGRGAVSTPSRATVRARLARRLVVTRLRKPANRNKFTRSLATKLQNCSPEQPCSSHACPICRAEAVDRFVGDCSDCLEGLGFRQTLRPENERTPTQRHFFRNADGREIAYVTIVPLSKIPIGELCTSGSVQKFANKLENVLLGELVTMFIFVLDISTHEHESGIFNPHYKIHAHGFMFLDEFEKSEAALRAKFPNKGNVKRGVQAKIYNGKSNAISYPLKEPKDRSIKLDKPLKNRNGKKPNRLRSAQHVEILQWMDQVGLDGRLIVHGAGTNRLHFLKGVRSEA